MDEVNVVRQKRSPLHLDLASSVLIGTEWKWMWMLSYEKKKKKKSWVTSSPNNTMLIISHKSALENLLRSVESIGIICYSIGEKILANLEPRFTQGWIYWLNTIVSVNAWTELAHTVTLWLSLLKQSTTFKLQAAGCFIAQSCLLQN